MRYCLITPESIDPNPGWEFITAGIKFLISKVDRQAIFENVNMFFEDLDTDFSVYDRLVICGNPRYDLGTKTGSWLYEKMLEKLQNSSVPIIDAWQGSACALGNTVQDDVRLLTSNFRNQNITKLLKKAKIIARDVRTQKVNKFFGLNSTLLPCSSFYAANFFNIKPVKTKTEKIVVLYKMTGYDGVIPVLRTLSRTHRIVATSKIDLNWCESIGVKHESIFDPVKLLELYAICKEVISYRLHATIPAASLGAKVLMMAIDTRAEACSLFDIPFVDYRLGVFEPELSLIPSTPDLSEVLKC